MANITGPQAMAYGGGPMEVTFGYPEGTSIIDIQHDYMKPLIDPHWRNFPPVNPMWHNLLGVLYTFIVFFAVTGNSMVVWLFNKHAPLRTPSNFLVVNLALSDLIMMTTNCPFFVYNCFSGGRWSLPAEYCNIYACLGAITGVCSIWTLAMISADRYNIICNGFNGPKLSKGKAAAMSLFAWFMAIGIALCPLIGWGGYGPEGILTSCSFDYLSQDIGTITYNLFMIIFDYFVPLFVIVGSYAMIVKAIFAHEEAMRAQAAKMNVKSLRTQEANEQRAEIRIAKTAIFNIGLWIVCWTPYTVITYHGCIGDFEGLKPLTTTLPALFAKSASCYNPFVYAIGHPKFRQAMTIHMPWFCVHEATKTADNESSTTAATEEKA
uniref:Opsin 2 n=1 Tax=Euphausia superba TaxID=6819 RepID=A0A142BLS7_EUPSU|nr:opsin 2 [Euphausia superba]